MDIFFKNFPQKTLKQAQNKEENSIQNAEHR